MRGYLTVRGHPIKSNLLFRREADRYFRMLVEGNTPALFTMSADMFMKGSHTFTEATTVAPWVDYFTAITNGSAMSSTGEVMRYRYKATELFEDFPDSTTRVAFAVGRAFVHHRNVGGAPVPNGILSLIDFGLNEIGNTWAHPTGRRAWFPETAIVATGLGLVDFGGTLALPAAADGHYIYAIRIISSGDDGSVLPAATFFFQQRPFHLGAYEAGAGQTDFVIASGSDALNTRFSATTGRGTINNALGIPNGSTSPTDAEVNYILQYPTATARTSSLSSVVSGMACDRLTPSRIWYCIADTVNAASANVIASRSLWTWDRMSGIPPKRRDANDPIFNVGIGSYPTLSTTGQYRDLKITRGGRVLLAVDAADDAGNGADQGALIQINAATNAIEAVIGTTSGVSGWLTNYTQGGLRQNNVLGIVIDPSESYAAAGHDRVWLIHRNGLSFADINNTTGVFGSWSTVANSGATFNTINASSVRGIAGYNFSVGAWSTFNAVGKLWDCDTSGNLYWVTTAGTQWDNGQQRVNKLTGDAATHTWYTLGTSAEVGAAGFMTLGAQKGGVTHVAGWLHCQRKDTGDPEPDNIWLSTANGGAGVASTQRLVMRIPVDLWGVGNNPGAAWYGNKLHTDTTTQPWAVKVTPDGQAWLYGAGTNQTAVLEALGRESTWSGTIDQFAAPIGNLQVISRAGGGSSFSSEMVGKRILISGSSSAGNNGSFIVDSFTDANTITIRNSAGVATGTGQAAPWNFNGAEFDARGTIAGAIGSFNGTLTTTAVQAAAYDWYPDDSGIAYVWQPRSGASIGNHAFNMHLSVNWQWSGSEWYRSTVPHSKAALGHAASTTPVALNHGVEVDFTNQNAGIGEFIADEYYSCLVTSGIGKDPTQELTYKYEFYDERTELIDERLTNKTATNGVARGAVRQIEDLTSNPPISTSLSYTEVQLAHHQRRLLLNGSNGTVSTTIANSTTDANNGFSVGIDLGASTIASKVICALGFEATAAFYSTMVIDLYSSNDNLTYELRSTYNQTANHPEWQVNVDAFHDSTTLTSTHTDSPSEYVVDLTALAANNAFVGVTLTNVAQRYWKFVFRTTSSVAAVGMNTIGIVAYDGSGVPIGMASDKFIGTANDSNYLANYVIRATWRQDNNSIAGGTTSGIGTTITLGSGSFAVDIVANDYFRELDGGGNILQEHKILSRDSSTQLTLATSVTTFAGSNWEVARDADVRPRDDFTQARFPAAAGEVYICPVTGWIAYHATDVSATRVLRVERYVKVKRSL
jgi:hypothetical protein